jgi:hypothetical protein
MAQWIHVSLQRTNFYTRYNFYDEYYWEFTNADLQSEVLSAIIGIRKEDIK